MVVQELLAAQGKKAGIRTVQRAVEQHRCEKRAAEVASVRFETAPGEQMQIDFGEKWVSIAGERVKVHLLAAVLGYSRRIYVRAFLSERQDDWFEGIAGAFRHFGGVTRTLLGDNPRALVSKTDWEAGTVTFNPRYLGFCRDWDVTPKACRPFRARTKGKVESGVKYVKRKALAGRKFETFAALEAHLAEWMLRVDERVHGTTNEVPAVRFAQQEAAALRPLPALPVPVRERRLRRKVANDALVDVDTVRYSVPHQLVTESVEVAVGPLEVRVFWGSKLVATHARSTEPHAIVKDPAHYAGLLRRPDAVPATAPADDALRALGRSLDEYAEVLGVTA